MAEPLLTEAEHKREYGDLKYLGRVKTIEQDEISAVKNFHVRKLQLVLAKSGVFHLSLKKSLVRYNNRLSDLRELLKHGDKNKAMDKFSELRSEAAHIEKHLMLSRKIIRAYYASVNSLISEEGQLDSLMAQHYPEFIDQEENKLRQAKLAEMTKHVKQDLIHIRYVLVELDNLFSSELKELVEMVKEQVRQTHENIFNYAKINLLFEQMQKRFSVIMEKAGRLKKDVAETERDLIERYEIVQMVMVGK